MEVIFVILPLALLMAGGFLAAFFWSVHRGQFDDLDTPCHRAIFDDDDVGEGPAGPDRADLQG